MRRVDLINFVSEKFPLLKNHYKHSINAVQKVSFFPSYNEDIAKQDLFKLLYVLFFAPSTNHKNISMWLVDDNFKDIGIIKSLFSNKDKLLKEGDYILLSSSQRIVQVGNFKKGELYFSWANKDKFDTNSCKIFPCEILGIFNAL